MTKNKFIQKKIVTDSDYISFLRSRFIAPNVTGISDRWLLLCFDNPENKREFFNENNRRMQK